MTVADKAKEIVSHIRHMSDADAAEFMRAHLNIAHAEGFNSGVEHARQLLESFRSVEAA